MKSNLFKNFKTLKQKEEEFKPKENDAEVDNVSVESPRNAELEKRDNVSAHVLEKVDNVSVDNVKKEAQHEIDNGSVTGVEPQIFKPKNLEHSEVDSTESSEDLSVADKQSVEIPVKKNRPVKKELQEAKETIGANYGKYLAAGQSKKYYTMYLKPDSYEFLKDLMFYKVTVERLIFYNLSAAFTEALQLLLPTYKTIQPRPDSIKEQEKNKKGGRKRNVSELYITTTSVYIAGEYVDFIKDVSYNQVINGKMYYKDWDLIEDGIQKLKKKYGNNIQPRPDYIREDEKLRARKPKADS